MKTLALTVTLLLVVGLGQLALGADFSQVRIAHLSPDAPTVDVRVDGTLVWGDVESIVITSYLLLRAGEHHFQFNLTGDSSPVVDTVVTLQDHMAYTLTTLGPWNQGDIVPVLFTDDLSRDLFLGKVRFLHASPELSAVDIAIAGGPVLYENLAFGQATNYITMAPGDYALEMRLAGTDEVVLSMPGFSVNARVNCTVFTLGSPKTKLMGLPVADLNSRVNIVSIWLGALLWAAIVGWFITATSK